MKKILLPLLLAVVIAVPGFAQMADKPMGEHREGHGPMMDKCNMDRCGMDMMGDMMAMCLEHAETIGLSDDQLAKMKPIHNEMQKKQAQFRADLKIAEIDLREIMDVKEFDIEKASSGVKKIAAIMTDHHLEMLKAMQEMRTLLTDEQFAKMKKSMPMKMDEKKSEKKVKK